MLFCELLFCPGMDLFNSPNMEMLLNHSSNIKVTLCLDTHYQWQYARDICWQLVLLGIFKSGLFQISNTLMYLLKFSRYLIFLAYSKPRECYFLISHKSYFKILNGVHPIMIVLVSTNFTCFLIICRIV